MSASKKKQQRREAIDPTKVTEAQAKQAAYKKKARRYTVIGIIIAVLVVILLVWNSGIFQKNATAATLGDDTLNVAELGYYYYDVRQVYAMYGLISSSMDDASTIYNESEGTTYRDYFLECALSDAQRTHALYSDAVAHGYTAADVQSTVDSEISNLKASASQYGYDYKSFLKAVYGRYASPAVVEKLLTRAAIADLYYSNTTSETESSFNVSDLDAYYAEHPDDVDTVSYSYLYFRAESVNSIDNDGNERSEEELAALKEAAMADAKADAEQALKFYEGGMEVSVLIEKTAPTSSADHTSAVGTSNISSLYRDQLLELAENEAAIVEQESYGYYVIVFHSRGRDETLSANVRHILIQAATTTNEDGDTVAPTEDAWAAALAEIEQIKAEYESGEQTAEAFAALAEKYSDDGGSNTNGGLYQQVTEGYFVTEFNDWLFAEEGRAVGDVAVIRHEGDAESESYPYWGYHLTYFDGWDEAAWQLSVRDTLTDDAMDQWLTDLCDACPAALASGSKNVAR